MAMHDELLMSVISAGGQRWESLLARAIAAHLRRSLAAGDEAFEDVAGRLEDWLLDALCSLRAVNAARGSRGDQGEALAEAGESLVRLSACLAEMRCDALAATKGESKK
jgi:hypothetical protein